MALEFNLDDEERFKLNLDGNKYIYNNRLSWAISILEETNLLIRPLEGFIKITKAGLKVLELNWTQDKVLEQRPEYSCDMDYIQNELEHKKSDVFFIGRMATAEKIIESNYLDINKKLAQDLLLAIKTNTPQFFERLVVNLLVKMGYGGTYHQAARVIGKSRDGGIDGVINQDRLGLDKIYIQAKRWEKAVGRPEIQKFSGALQGSRANKGVFITTADFTRDAQAYVKNIDSRIILVNGTDLTNFMIENNVGVSINAVYEIKKIDSDYFNYE